jgi:hypothetical protein
MEVCSVFLDTSIKKGIIKIYINVKMNQSCMYTAQGELLCQNVKRSHNVLEPFIRSGTRDMLTENFIAEQFSIINTKTNEGGQVNDLMDVISEQAIQTAIKNKCSVIIDKEKGLQIICPVEKK